VGRGSEKTVADNGTRFDMLMPPDMARAAATAGLKKVQMDFLRMMLLGICAGAFIAMGACFYTVVVTGAGALPFGVGRLLGGLAFCLGLILVVVAGAELFTGNNLIVMAVASGAVGVRHLLRNWAIVYVGNLVGSALAAWLVWQGGQAAMGGGAVGAKAVAIANAKCGLAFWPALVRGVLCNGLVCLAVWLCLAGRSVTDKILAILFPITAFVACGFEHCVANMYFIPLGLFLKASGVPVVGADRLTWGGFVGGNLLPVTIGNIIGGAGLVGMVFWIIYCRREPTYRSMMK